ncbi:MAG: Glucosyl-3-phosphoglycerate/mannosyl-3-phosphoglycerate phosphatase [Syntrophomonadaceae bacterium]|nr:Glucosyl-3-phosphoglycerate/mannosyl-3-phosphoglycerate phosphatase [Bacillota bacterium]
MKLILFTDLDGTLLNSYTYSYQESLQAINLLKRKQIPIIFCSAKTQAEQEVYRKALGITDPFIVEGGGGILIPQDYFPFAFDYCQRTRDYDIIKLGSSYEQVISVLKKVKEKSDCRIMRFGNLTIKEIAQDSGLSPKMAALARQRKYTETFKIEGTKKEVKKFLLRIEEEGLSWCRGERYYRIKGKTNKGKATRILIELFKKAFGKIKSVAIGNGPNDRSLLEAVELPLIVQRQDSKWEEMEIHGLHHIEGIGPTGWSYAARKFVAYAPYFLP